MITNPSGLPEDLYNEVVEKMASVFNMTHDEATACQSACSEWLRGDGAKLMHKAIRLEEPEMVINSFVSGWLAQKNRIQQNQ